MRPDGLSHLLSCSHLFPLSRQLATAANEVLGALCNMLGIPDAILDAWLDYRIVSGETYRFESFLAALDLAGPESDDLDDQERSEDAHWTHQASVMVVLNSLVAAVSDAQLKRDLVAELDRRGLDDYLEVGESLVERSRCLDTYITYRCRSCSNAICRRVWSIRYQPGRMLLARWCRALAKNRVRGLNPRKSIP